jgi:septal ring factor EnvC (AmiA/AmiB activator)
MKKVKWLSTGFTTLLLATLFLTGCSSGISQQQYDAVIVERDSLTVDKAALQSQVSSAQSQVTGLQTDKQNLQSQITSLTANMTIIQNDLENLQSNYNDIKSSRDNLQSQLDDANAELAAINSVYPAGEFVSETELLLWLDQNTVSDQSPATTVEGWVNKALQVQAAALFDGYTVSVDYDYDATTEIYTVYNTTVIGGLIYFWDPETDEVTRESNLGAVE